MTTYVKQRIEHLQGKKKNSLKDKIMGVKTVFFFFLKNVHNSEWLLISGIIKHTRLFYGKYKKYLFALWIPEK